MRRESEDALPGTLRGALAVALIAVLLGAPAAVAAGRLGAGHDTTWVANPPTGNAAPGRTTDPVTRVAMGSIEAVLTVQAEAVRAGDAAAFLAAVDPALQPVTRRRFEAVRALKATAYGARLVAPPEADGERWKATVEVRFCAGADGCGAAPIQVPTAWVVHPDGAVLVEWGQSTRYGPRPWEVSELRAAVGARVVVAASPRYASRIRPTLEAAERAAAKADRYARWRPLPARYVVYLAGTDEWSTWYGVQQPSWAAGFAMPITAEHTEIVLNANRIDANEAFSTLTHEFAHVTSLAGVQRNYTDSWLLVEGLAEYVANADRPAREYPWVAGTRRYVHETWAGTAALAAPPESATVNDATGRYGVAYLAVRRLAERFGEDRMLAFFAAVARDGRPPVEAAPGALGVPWQDAAADCDRYVRGITG